MRTDRAPLRLLLAVAALLAGGEARAIDIAVTGSWSESIDASDLVSGAGSDLSSTSDSAVDEVTLDISSTLDATDAWEVDVRRSDTTWPSGVRVWVERTSSGTGPGSVSGGSTWHEVGATDTTLLTGAGDRTGIDLRLRLTGLSVTVPPASYLTSIVYTVVDTP